MRPTGDLNSVPKQHARNLNIRFAVSMNSRTWSAVCRPLFTISCAFPINCHALFVGGVKFAKQRQEVRRRARAPSIAGQFVPRCTFGVRGLFAGCHCFAVVPKLPFSSRAERPSGRDARVNGKRASVSRARPNGACGIAQG
eukprot:11201867-Lingulodinium_polyedra.AAC.1